MYINNYFIDGVTTQAPEPCCNKLKLTINGNAASHVSYLEGTYDMAGTVNGHDYWTMDLGYMINGQTEVALWYSNGWKMFVASSLGGSSGSVFGPATLCPGDQADGWSHYNGAMVVDSGTDIQWECLGIFFFKHEFTRCF